MNRKIAGATIMAAILTGTFVTAGVTAAATGRAGVHSHLVTAESAPWYDTNGNAADNRANLNERVLTPAVVPKIRYLRSMAAPLIQPSVNDCPGQGIVAPVLAGGYLYAVTNQKVSKYNAATGALVWRSTPSQIFQWIYESVAYSNGLVIVGALNCESVSDPTGMVYAFNAATGALAWSSSTSGPLEEAVVAGSYVVTAGASDAAGYQVAVLSLSNGKIVWARSGCVAVWPPYWRPVVVAQVVMSYGCDSQGNQTLEASNLATGTKAWVLPGAWVIQRGDVSGAPGKHLYATNPSGTVVGLNPLTGQVQYSLSQAVTVLAVGSKRIYASCGSQGKNLCGYNISTGALEWQKAWPAPALAAEADGVLYLDSGAALNAATGQLITGLWSGTATAVAVGDGRIVVVSDPRVVDLFGLKGY